MPDNISNTTVYYDGSCPLCAVEIRHYRGLDSDNKLDFVNVSEPDAVLPDTLTRQQAMARFHVKAGSGDLISGARAFAEVWTNLPTWRWAAWLAGIPGVMHLLEVGYSASLLIRPAISGLIERFRHQVPVNQGRDS